jgi:ribosomal protein S18 acetylase RimI-like enzyme
MTFIVVEEGGSIVGVAAFHHSEPGVVEMHWVYVLPKFQRMGVGTRLVSWIEDRARRDGRAMVRLATPSEATWAVRFYEGRGYAVAGTRPNPWGLDVILEKVLDR